MIDDVLSFVKIAEILKDRGAYKIYVMATHGLLSSDAPRLIEDSCIDEVCMKLGTTTLYIGLLQIKLSVFRFFKLEIILKSMKMGFHLRYAKGFIFVFATYILCQFDHLKDGLGCEPCDHAILV